VNCLCFNREYYSILATGSNDKQVKLWDLKSRNFSSMQTLDDARDSISNISMTNELIIVTSIDGNIRTYDLRMGRMIQDEIGGILSTAKLSSDDKCLAVATLDSKIKLIDINDGDILNQYTGHVNQNFKVDCHFYKNFLISGSEDSKIYFWNVVDAKLVKTLRGHMAAVCCLDVSEEYLLSGSQDSSILVWPTKNIKI
jgi:mitogen-activated protein kinase organizer 1